MEVLTIQQAVVSNIGLLTKILKVAIRVTRFRQDCKELGSMVASLLAMVGANNPRGDSEPSIVTPQGNVSPQGHSELVEEHSRVQPLAHPEQPNLLEDQAARRLQSVLKEIQVFVEKCTEEWNFWQRGWEVAVGQNLPRLKRELFEWVILCIMEYSVSGTSYSSSQT
jgi:hypothetical protein